MKNEIEQCETISMNFVRGGFESKLGALQVHIIMELMAILIPFLSFIYTYSVSKVQNMLVLMLDLCFKSLEVVKTFVGKATMI
jgi:hypothetical protein